MKSESFAVTALEFEAVIAVIPCVANTQLVNVGELYLIFIGLPTSFV